MPLDVRTGKVFASCPQTIGIASFMALMGQVMSHEPDNSALWVLVIADNGSGHRSTKAIRRLRDAHLTKPWRVSRAMSDRSVTLPV